MSKFKVGDVIRFNNEDLMYECICERFGEDKYPEKNIKTSQIITEIKDGCYRLYPANIGIVIDETSEDKMYKVNNNITAWRGI